jgi:hypothetical protein
MLYRNRDFGVTGPDYANLQRQGTFVPYSANFDQ